MNSTTSMTSPTRPGSSRGMGRRSDDGGDAGDEFGGPRSPPRWDGDDGGGRGDAADDDEKVLHQVGRCKLNAFDP